MVEGVTMRIGEAERDIDVDLLGSRLVAKHARVGAAHRRAVGRLDLRLVERALLEEQAAAGPQHEAVGRVVRVG